MAARGYGGNWDGREEGVSTGAFVGLEGCAVCQQPPPLALLPESLARLSHWNKGCAPSLSIISELNLHLCS